MKRIYFLVFLCVHFVNAQISLPYVNNFNNPSSDENWSHYAITGIDDWGRGVTSGSINTTDLAWETKLGGTPSYSSNMVLESPTFDLKDKNLSNYVLSFRYKSDLNVGNFYLEYTIDSGTSWLLLNPTTTFKKNWQSTSGFSTRTANFLNSVINISFLQGNSKVKFRYRLNTLSYGNGYGFVIDDFSILPEYYNIYASQGSPIEITPLCSQFTVITSLNFQNQYTESYALVTNYYLSNDTILDDTDTMIGFNQSITNGTVLDINKTFTTPPNLLPGQYYILYQHDFTNQLNENDENDNVGFCSVVVKPILSVPYSNDFEIEDANWKTKTDATTTLEIWQRGSGTRHHIEKAHSGISAWHTSNTIIPHPDNTFQYLESPSFNLSSIAQPLVLSFWYKAKYNSAPNFFVQYSLNCSNTWVNLYTISENSSDEWESINITLNSAISSNPNVRFRITYKANYQHPEGIIFDDFYIGPLKADLSIEQIYSNKRFTSTDNQTDVLKYQIRNAGSDLLQSCITKFYWSTDNQLDTNDVLLSEQSITSLVGDNIGKWMSFSYTKPTLLSGIYYIIYVIDPTNQIDEIRENNNTGVIPIEQLSTYGFPYYNDFETNTDNWTHEATLGQDEWEYGTPQGVILDTAFSGSKAWISNKLSKGVSPMSRMHLYTPAFNLSTAKNPVLEFDMKLDNYGGCSCYQLTANMSYSIDNGATWIILNSVNDSYSKWYKIMAYNPEIGQDYDYSTVGSSMMFSKGENSFSNHVDYNSRDVDRNTKYIIDISQLKNETNIRFRYNLATLLENGGYFSSNGPSILEGAMIDNFQIREAEIDLSVPYVKNIYLSALAKKLNFSIDVKNSGNYISNASDIKFYLSNDMSFNSGDYYIGNADLAQIRPEFKSHKILELALPNNLSDYKYLIYVIDDANTNIETNETNNQGYWDLGLSGVSSFPYSENFEGDVVNGWNGYAYVNFTSNVLTNHRVTNRIAVSLKEDIYTKFYNGALRTENVPYGYWQTYLTPMYYIQSPTFNFTAYNSSEPLVMAFDIVSVGKNYTNGANMEYSIDGGSTWILLTAASAPSFNWYQNYQTMSDFKQPGWFDNYGEMKSVKMDISFLKDQSNVVFRYKFYSNFAINSISTSGFRLDNFSIGQETLVNQLNCFESLPYSMNFDNIEVTCWEIGKNDGSIILLNRAANQDIQWEIADNFANSFGNSSAKIDLNSQGNTQGVWLISPKFNMVEGNKLKFNIALNQLGNFNTSTLDSDDQVKLMYSVNNGLSWTDLKIWNNASVISNTGQLELINSLPVSGYVRFAFWATNGALNNGNNSTFYVDDFELYTGSLGVSKQETTSLSFYPNPVVDWLHINSSTEQINVAKLYTISGQLLETLNLNNKNISIDFRTYPKGVYFVELNSGDKSKTLKVLK